MGNKVVRRLAVSSSGWLDGWGDVIERLANPRLFNCMSPSVPSNGKLGKLEEGRIGADNFSKRQNLCVLGPAVSEARELPAVIVGIMGDMQNRFVACEYLLGDNHGATARLIKWPRGAYHLTRPRSATTGESVCGGGMKGSSHGKPGRTPASGWLHRLVRPFAVHGNKLSNQVAQARRKRTT